jgi:hypothetical protein
MLLAIKLMLVSVLAGALSACIDLGPEWDDETIDLQVDYYKAQCDQSSSNLCFRSREDEGDSWNLIDEPFNGFDDFVWGTRYWTRTRVSYNSEGKPTGYRLVSVSSSETIASSDSAFSLSLYSGAGILLESNEAEWQLGGEQSFLCGDFCSEISSAVGQAYVLNVEFSIESDELQLNNVICSSSEEDFSSDCEGETEVSWQIAPFRSECGLAEASTCLLYRLNSSDDFELLVLEEGITGFDYEWGNQYRIDVSRTVSDGGNITEVSLLENDASPDDRTGDDNDFLFIVRGSSLSQTGGDGLIALYDEEISMNCERYSQCSDMNGRVSDDEWMLLNAFVDEGAIVVTDLVCHEDSLADFRACTDDQGINWEI